MDTPVSFQPWMFTEEFGTRSLVGIFVETPCQEISQMLGTSFRNGRHSVFNDMEHDFRPKLNELRDCLKKRKKYTRHAVRNVGVGWSACQ